MPEVAADNTGMSAVWPRSLDLDNEARIELEIFWCAAGLHVAARVADDATLADAVVGGRVHVPVHPEICLGYQVVEA